MNLSLAGLVCASWIWVLGAGAVADKWIDAVPNAAGEVVVDVSKDVKIRLLGVAPFLGENDSWYAINGEPIKAPEMEMPIDMHAQQPPDHQLLLRIDKPKGTIAKVRVKGAEVVGNMVTDSDEDHIVMLSAFKLGANQNTAEVEINTADAAWKTLATIDNLEQGGEFDGKEIGPINVLPIEDADGGASVVIEHNATEQPCEVVATDDQGKQQRPRKVQAQSDGEQMRVTYGFEIPAKQVKKLLVQVRPFSKVVAVKEISLEKGRFTKPQVLIRDADATDAGKK